MAAYIKTLKDAAGADIIYPQTKASVVFTEEGETVESALQEKVDIQMSSSQPTNQKNRRFLVSNSLRR